MHGTVITPSHSTLPIATIPPSSPLSGRQEGNCGQDYRRGSPVWSYATYMSRNRFVWVRNRLLSSTDVMLLQFETTSLLSNWLEVVPSRYQFPPPIIDTVCCHCGWGPGCHLWTPPEQILCTRVQGLHRCRRPQAPPQRSEWQVTLWHSEQAAP